jgi:hypothetical protein
MGTILVLGVFVFTKYGPRDEAVANTLVSVAPTRSYVEEEDSDGDGIPDWEEALKARIIDSITIPTTTAKDGVPYEKPTTFTGQFAESFLTDYLKNKQGSGGNPLEDPEALVESAISAVASTIVNKTYAVADIGVVPADQDSIREYGNTIARIMLSKPYAGEPEVVITANALKTNNPEELKKLDVAKQNYKSMVGEMLDAPTPGTYANLHLSLINGYEAIYSDIDAMGQAFTDPLYATARFKQHYDDIKSFFATLKEVQNKLLLDGIVYEKNEPGAYLYIFKL